MSKDEKVIAEWPEHLTNEGQVLDPLPEEGQTDFVIFRFQGEDVNHRFANQVKQFAIDLNKKNSGEFDLSFVSVTQKRNRFVPKNSWPMVRGMFDYMMNWTKAQAGKR